MSHAVRPAPASVRLAALRILAASVVLAALAAGGCVTHEPCPCDDRELNPRRPGRDGRSSASLDSQAGPGYNSSLRDGVAVAMSQGKEESP